MTSEYTYTNWPIL